MSYLTQSRLADDINIRVRVTACVAREGVESPEAGAYEQRWRLSAQPGWDAAYAYAIAIGSEEPGLDEAVITDGMILSAAQALQQGPSQ